jgi:hypothetical protein
MLLNSESSHTMIEFHGPNSWTLGGVLRWGATVVLTLCIGVLAEENLRHLIEEHHWNEALSHVVDMLPDLSSLLENKLFWLLAGLSAGIALATWIVKLGCPSRESYPLVAMMQS